MNNLPIGIFDSGVGGLTVLNKLKQAFPYEKFIYFGDNGRAPYGNKSKEELLQFNKEVINFLLSKKIKLLVMACNTSCALTLKDIKNEFYLPIIDLIDPTSYFIAHNNSSNRIAVLATEKTVSSSIYKSTILQYNSKIKIIEISCPDLVPIVEENKIDSIEGKEKALKYFQKAIEFKADTIVYGCSHYPFFEKYFKSINSTIKNFIDPANIMVDSVKKFLISSNLFTNKFNEKQIDFFVSGDVDKFNTFLENYLGWKNQKITQNIFNLETSYQY